MLAVNKPNNILVHHSKMANNKRGEVSLVQLIKDELGETYYPIHRLDRKTSGIILFSKKKEFISQFQALFAQNLIGKTYFGVVRGFTPKNGIIDTDVKGRDAKKYKSAFTNYTKIAQIELPIAVHPYDKSRYSLLKLEPTTGRLHQLRIHLNKINHPLVGDPKYGDRFHNRMFVNEFDCSNLFLHASHIKFSHPFFDEKISIKAEFPLDWIILKQKFLWSLYLD